MSATSTTTRRPHRARAALGIVALCALLAVGGCDVLGIGDGLTYSGVVVDAETGAPVEGIHVSLQVGSGGFGLYNIVEVGFTDRTGVFRLETDRRDTRLYVNSPGYGGEEAYRADYSSRGPLPRGSGDFRIELQHLSP